MSTLVQLRELRAAAKDLDVAARNAADAAARWSGRATVFFDLAAAAEDQGVAETQASGADSATNVQIKRLRAELRGERARTVALEAELASLRSYTAELQSPAWQEADYAEADDAGRPGAASSAGPLEPRRRKRHRGGAGRRRAPSRRPVTDEFREPVWFPAAQGPRPSPAGYKLAVIDLPRAWTEGESELLPWLEQYGVEPDNIELLEISPPFQRSRVILSFREQGAACHAQGALHGRQLEERRHPSVARFLQPPLPS